MPKFHFLSLDFGSYKMIIFPFKIMGSCINTASLLPQESQHKSYLEEKYDFAILSAREEFGVLFQSKRTEKTFR